MIKNKFLPFFIFISLFCFDNSLAEQVSESDSFGADLFIEKRCVRCHTVGRGRFVGPDLFGVVERYSRDEIKKWVVNPTTIYEERKKMPKNSDFFIDLGMDILQCLA